VLIHDAVKVYYDNLFDEAEFVSGDTDKYWDKTTALLD